MSDAFTLHLGDVREVLPKLATASVDCVATSPPYWRQRDYGEPGQIGREPTPGEYVANLVGVFRELRRVLAAHGTCWLNLGDSYSSGTLAGIPWRAAFALEADGWLLCSDVVWSKPNPMPESVTRRPTKSHEYVFLLAKDRRYYFDQEAVREPAEWATPRLNGAGAEADGLQGGRNVRSVWEIPTAVYPGAHFAVWPELLAERMLKAGCATRVCRSCGKPRERIVESFKSFESGSGRSGRMPTGKQDLSAEATNTTPDIRLGPVVYTRTVGWSDCGHDAYRPGVALDPFLGSGTSAVVARRLGLDFVGVELSPEYAELARGRMARWWKSPARPSETPEGQEALFARDRQGR